MIKPTRSYPFLKRVPEPLRSFGKAGKVANIFRPRILRDGVWATVTGYGVSFEVDGVDSEGLDRATLDRISQKIAAANRMLPLECQLFEYLAITKLEAVAARQIEPSVVRQHAQDRLQYLEQNATFKQVRLFVTIYFPGKLASDAEEFALQSRKAVRAVQNTAVRYQDALRSLGIRRLTRDEVVQLYSYLLNLESPLVTQRAAAPTAIPKKLGRVHIGVEGEYLRVGRRYCQMLSVNQPPRGTRPDLWAAALIGIDCEMVWCQVFQRKPGSETRTKAQAVENAIGMAVHDIWAGVVNGYNPYLPPPKRATTYAQEKRVEEIGDVLVDLDGKHYYGQVALFGLIHSRDPKQIEAVLPRIHAVLNDPSEASVLEEKRGAVSAYLSCFPGQPYNVRKFWLRGDHKANLSFVYRPFLGYPQSDDLQDEYTQIYETRQGTPFFWTPFNGGNGNTIVLGGPSLGKSLNTNSTFAAAMKYGTKTFLFDQGGSYETNVRALGGSVTHLGLTRPRLNLFRVEATKDNLFAIAHIVRLMLTKSGIKTEAADHHAIEKGVERMFDTPQHLRRLSYLRLPIHLQPGLKRWTQGGIYGEIFDNFADDLEFHDLQLFDFASLGEKHTELLDVEMSWILTLCQNIIRDPANLGIPKHVVLDELWKRTGVAPVVSFLLETIKADRKNLAWATLVTQSLEDLGPHVGRVKNACPNTMFCGGAFDQELYRTTFQLNARELEQFRQLSTRELAVKVDGEPFVGGGNGYFKVLRMNMDPGAYMRATTKPSERILRESEEGREQLRALASYAAR